MSTEIPDDLAIIERAHEWYNILRKASPAEHAAFVEWLRESPRNVGEFMAVTAVYREFDSPDYGADIDVDVLLARDDNVVALRADALREPAPVVTTIAPIRRMRWRTLAMAAMLAMATSVTGLWSWSLINTDRYATSVGENRTVSLDDGSKVQLNTASRIRVEFSDEARDIHLVEGEALFTVASDPIRPFRVRSGQAIIQAVGTQFNVYRRGDATMVSVLEGRVAVAESGNPAPAKLLEAGKAVEMLPRGIMKPKSVDVAKVTAWREKRLIFQSDRLADIVAEFNRYNEDLRFEIANDDLADERFTGIFDANAPESFVRILEDLDGLRIERKDDLIVVDVRR